MVNPYGLRWRPSGHAPEGPRAERPGSGRLAAAHLRPASAAERPSRRWHHDALALVMIQRPVTREPHGAPTADQRAGRAAHPCS